MDTEFKNSPRIDSSLKELDVLKNKAAAIRGDSEAFVEAAKRLSKVGIKDAEKLIAFAKDNWKSVLAATALLGVSGVALGRSRMAKKAAGATKKLAKKKLTKTAKGKKVSKKK